MGVFFVGAYQETLGDLHNLFGDTNVVTIDLRTDGGFDLLHEQEGDTISQVLSYVEFDPHDCVAAFRKMVDEAISTAGGVRLDALDDGLMLRALPGVFCAGEMLDWEAPTGGYLINGCLATGLWAGRHAAAWVRA